MIHIEKIIIPHSDSCKKVKNPKKIGCANLEIIDSDLFFKDEAGFADFRVELRKERGIYGITFSWTERFFFVNANCIFV